MLLAIDETQEIFGVLGYIPYREDRKKLDVFLSLWKVRPDSHDNSLGLKLLEELLKHTHYKNLFCVGINLKTKKIYDYLGYKTGKMTHYYWVNPNLSSFYIGKFPPTARQRSMISKNNLIEVNKSNVIDFFDKIIPNNSSPSKDAFYFSRRYLTHPYFEYGFFTSSSKNGLVVLREVQIEDRKILKIIDFFGQSEDLREILSGIKSYVVIKNYEFVDCYHAGVFENVFVTTDFHINQGSEEIIVPNYFEPFLQQNIDIYYFSSQKVDFSLFRGDGDQDRPSLPRSNKL